MEIVIAAVVLAAGLVIAALLLVKRAPGLATATRASSPALAGVGAEPKPPSDGGDALAERQEMGRLEERLVGKEAAIEARISELDAREVSLEQRVTAAEEAHERHVRATVTFILRGLGARFDDEGSPVRLSEPSPALSLAG